MEWRHVLIGLACALAVCGAYMVIDAAVTLENVRVEAAACEARTQGLQRLSCMDFRSIDAGFQLYGGGAFLLAALVFGGVGAWLARPVARRPEAWWSTSAAAGILAAILGWAMGSMGFVSGFLASILIALAIVALATAAVALQASGAQSA